MDIVKETFEMLLCTHILYLRTLVSLPFTGTKPPSRYISFLEIESPYFEVFQELSGGRTNVSMNDLVVKKMNGL